MAANEACGMQGGPLFGPSRFYWKQKQLSRLDTGFQLPLLGIHTIILLPTVTDLSLTLMF